MYRDIYAYTYIFLQIFYISSYIYNVILNHFENPLQKKNNARQTKFMKIYTKTKQVFMIISIYTIYTYIYFYIFVIITHPHTYYTTKKKNCAT